MVFVLDKKAINIILFSLIAIITLLAALLFGVEKVIVHNVKNKRMVALTFDDGPNILYTPEVLKILSENKIKATFFVVGEKVNLHPEIFKQIINDGHEVGNHTFTHPYMDKVSKGQIGREIREGTKIIEHFTGCQPKWFRPPRGFYNVNILKEAANQGYTVVLWDLCVENASTLNGIEMTLRSLKKAKRRIVVLLHDGGLDRKETIKALPLIIYGLKQRGYKFTTLSQLVNTK